jgi:pimeloyl-ACP methyl ester carboxylesterase
MTVVPLSIVAATLLGWSDPITVSPVRGDRAHSSFARNLANLDRPSERTLDTLRRYDLDRRYRKDVDGALAQLENIARSSPEPELVFALAELSWVEGRRLDRWRKSTAIDRYVDAVAYAYDFLFDPHPRLVAGRRPSDPHYRLACDLYNGGLERLIRAAQSDRRIEADGTIRLKVHGKQQVFRVALERSPWKPEDVDQILLACDFEVSGLEGRTYQYGVGVPLIGIHHADQASKDGVERFYPPEMAFPLTAFLVPNSRLNDPNADVEDVRECTLQLVDPVQVPVVGREPGLPVESDFTGPLAYMWSRTDLNRYRWTGLFRPGEALGRANLMLLRPYEPNKIPVVMVHGLVSSPLAWIPMLNDLLRDPTIQTRYQIMLYMYPTGVPLPIAASGLRDSLLEAQRMYDPSGTSPTFNQMVLLGHSMGGLLSHMMTVESGDRLWQLNSDRRFDEMIGPPKVLEELKHYLFFHPLPFVRRVVFLATPHRGSEMSRGMVGRMGSNLISDADQVASLLSRLVKDNPEAFPRRFRRLPSSIETLSPDSPMLEALLAMKPGPGVTYHSIIGSQRAEGVAQTTDGVVPYRSAHLDGVASERIVRSDHSVQKDPEAIREVHRILLLHLSGNEVAAEPLAAPATSQPVPTTSVQPLPGAPARR